MTEAFLFRFDGSRDNDRYLECARARGFVLFAGKELRLGPGWIPDYMRVVVEDEGRSCKLAIIELEADANTARISARKYLPESSQSVVDALFAYLERACIRCRATADPRLESITKLKDILQECETIVVVAAGCQRDSFDSIEELPLIDQDHGLRPTRANAERKPRRGFVLNGDVTLSPVEHKNLSRTVLILDAVVRGWDKSGASFRNWRSSRAQPLRAALRADPGQFSELGVLMLGNKLGVQVDVDRVAAELASVWTSLSRRQYTPDSVLRALQQYLPIASGLPSSIAVREAFEKARPFL
jgi:hypothetical protein